jgi:molybdopterin adenylyltransferase
LGITRRLLARWSFCARGVVLGFQAKVLTVSDGVIAGTRIDSSGASLRERLEALGYEVVEQRVVADGKENVSEVLLEMSNGFAGLIVTTGGTGFSKRDETPEGTLAVLERLAPGVSEAMRLVSPLGRLSRGVAGVRGDTLIINLPGSPKGAIESIAAVEDILDHALSLLLDYHSKHPNSDASQASR